MRYPDDVQQSNVPFATLDPANIIPVQTRQLCQSLLGQPALGPQFADSLAKKHSRIRATHLMAMVYR